MARKRKIPARKHHGIRDPLKQIEDKEKKLKNFVNNPPEKGKGQKLSFKFSQFKKLADVAKTGKKIKRIHSGREDKPRNNKQTMSKASGNKLRNIKQFSEETDEDYLKRVNRMTTESLREAEYEAKYGVSVLRNSQTGEISIKKRPKNEIDELLKQKQTSKIVAKQGRKCKIMPKQRMDPKMAKALIKQAIKEVDEEAKQENTKKIEEYKHDVFQFGEVVHAPPTLATPRKAIKSETVPRPGKKNNLLLKNLLNEAKNEATVLPKSKVKTDCYKVTKKQLKGKRKDLPDATRIMLENEQSKMIELYRQLKKTKETAFFNKCKKTD